jgi:hypothetical protein
MLLVVLDDDPRRAAAMREAVVTIPGLTLLLFDNAPDLLEWLPGNLPRANTLALDHDLGPSRLRDGERFEPGIGRDVADYLATQPPTCPVIVHSTNGPAAYGMQFCLETAGWTVTRVHPFDDLAWVERDWLPEIERALGC